MAAGARSSVLEKMLKIGVNKEGNKYAPEELASISIEDVKK